MPTPFPRELLPLPTTHSFRLSLPELSTTPPIPVSLSPRIDAELPALFVSTEAVAALTVSRFAPGPKITVFVSSTGKLDPNAIVPLTPENVIVPPPAVLTSTMACLKEPAPASELLLTVKFTGLPVVLTVTNIAIAKDTAFICPAFRSLFGTPLTLAGRTELDGPSAPDH